MKPITYKEVFDEKGGFISVELWQNGEHISFDFSSGQTSNGHRWEEVRNVIEQIAEKVKKEVLESVKSSPYN